MIEHTQMVMKDILNQPQPTQKKKKSKNIVASIPFKQQAQVVYINPNSYK
jgi:hypothetical protein